MKNFIRESRGDAVVEAAILFPIMIMIFAALVMLSAYLPTRAALQRATQYAATALATEHSDAWLFYDLHTMGFYWETDKDRLGSVYNPGLRSDDDVSIRASMIVKDADNRLLSLKEGALTVEGTVNNKLFYKEVSVNATRKFTVPINLSIIGFPSEVVITVTSTAAVHNGDEFIRNMDLIFDFTKFISERYGIFDTGNTIGQSGSRFKSLLSR